MRNQILTATIAAIISVLATLAFLSGSSVSRLEVEKMITASEMRVMNPVAELKSDQKEILATVQAIQIDIAELRARGTR